MLSVNEQAELDAAMEAAWTGTTSASVAAGRLHEYLNDAVQAQRPWASIKLAEATDRGLVDLVKRYRKSRAVAVKKGQTPAVVGVQLAAAEWGQVALEQLTRDQVASVIASRRKQIAGLRRSISCMEALLRLLDEHPTAKTVGDALKRQRTTLSELMEAAA